ncbi:TIR domain-containing protein [Planctomyces sp. SH-PL14]|uniref:TIR domain-containing protein n=1 Tax=Planctomyces sp. SH-PL14 TaxID=1632864 RepID=UPI00078E7667|nr:TIR domain-containing protein [Planctomyces sp. SH-PL14]AMV18446.1 WD domain, G-beta repeat [Planctomyces sp. SH-PL14]
MQPPKTLKYFAFISYSHRDAATAAWLHRSLETYRVPRNFVGATGRGGPIPARLFPIFRDTEEIPTSSDLDQVIRHALRESAALIVICSPAAAASRWVNEEVRLFKQLYPERPVLPLIAAGEPNVSDKNRASLKECFPPALRHPVSPAGKLIETRRVEPIGADIRSHADTKATALMRLVAGLTGLAFDSLRQRDRQRRRKQQWTVGISSLALSAVVVGLLIYAGASRQQAEVLQNQLTSASDTLTERTEQLSQRDDDLVRSKKQLATSESGRFEEEYVNDIRSLPGLWEDGRVDLMRRRLDRYLPGKLPTDTPDLRGFEWHYWNRLTRGAGISLRGESRLEGLVWSADSAFVYGVTAKQELVRWNVASGAREILRDSETHTTGIGIDPTGARIAVLSQKERPGALQLLSADDLATRVTIQPRVYPFMSVAFRADGELIATADVAGGIELWNSKTGEQVLNLTQNRTSRRNPLAPTQFLDRHDGPVTCLAYSPDGGHVASGGMDGSLGIWNTRSGKCEYLRQLGSGAPLWGLAYSADGTRIVTRSSPTRGGHRDQESLPGELLVWDPQTKSELHRQQFPAEVPVEQPSFAGGMGLGAIFLNDDQQVASAEGHLVHLWDSALDADPLPKKGHAARITHVRAAPDGQRLASADESGEVLVWDAQASALGAPLVETDFPGRGLALGDAPGNYAVLRDRGVSVLGSGKEEPAEERQLLLYRDGLTVPLDQASGHFRDVASSADGCWIAVAAEAKVVVWDARTGKQHSEIGVAAPKRPMSSDEFPEIRAVAFSGSDSLCFLDRKTAWKVDIASGARTELPIRQTAIPDLSGDAYSGLGFTLAPAAIVRLAFDSQGSVAALGMGSGDVVICDTRDWKELATLRGHRRGITGLTFSPDGKRLVSCSGRHIIGGHLETNHGPGEIIVWGTGHWKECLRITADNDYEFSGVALDGTNQHLVAVGNRLNPTSRRLPTGQLLAWNTAESLPPSLERLARTVREASEDEPQPEPMPPAAPVGKAPAPPPFVPGFAGPVAPPRGLAPSQPRGPTPPPGARPPSPVPAPAVQRGQAARGLAGTELRWSSLGIAKGGHVGFTSIAVHPAINQVAAVSVLGDLVVWDVRSKAIRLERRLGENWGWRIWYSTDGERLFGTDYPFGRESVMVDVASGKLTNLEREMGVTIAANQTFGKLTTLESPFNGGLRLMEEGQPVEMPALSKLFARSGLFAAGGSLLAIPTDKELVVVSPGYRKVLFSAALRNETGAADEAPLYGFSLDQTTAYVASVEGGGKETHVLRQYRLPAGDLQPETVPLRWPVAISPDRAACLEQESGRSSGTIFSRSLAEGKRSEQPCAVEPDFRGAEFFRDGIHFATFGGQYSIHIWSRFAPAIAP